jgi:hypothetical protein
MAGQTPPPTGPRGGASGPFPFPPSQASQVSPEAVGKAVAVQLRPLVREEVAAALAQMQTQVQAQGQTLNTLDGRLQSLPPLVAAELRAALAQHDRNAAAKAPPPASGGLRGVLVAMAAGMVLLLVAVVALAVKALR